MTEIRPAERRRRFRPPQAGLLALWLTLLLLVVAGFRAQAAQEPVDPGAGASQDTAAAGSTVEPAASGQAAPVQETTRQFRRVELTGTHWWERAISTLGLAVMVLIAWIFSVDRRAFPWRIVWWGVALQFVFALLILQTPPGRQFFALMNDVVIRLLQYTQEGAKFIFGNLIYNNVPVGIPGGEPTMAPLREVVTDRWANVGSFFAFTVLPTIIFFSSLMTILYYLKVMQALVKAMAWVMQRTMGTSGAESLSTAGNVFLGQTEAPLMVKPFVQGMTMSELNCVMVGGFANVAGGVLVAYVGMLYTYFPDIAGHLLAVSVMSAPATVVIAKVMYPEDGEPETRGTLKADVPSPDVNVIDAASRGASEGLALALNVGAMLLAFIALIAVLNGLLGWLGGLVGLEVLSLEWMLGWLMAPIAWVMGVPWGDARIIGSLLGVKTVVNEFVAYLQLANLLQEGALDPRSVVIASYALCGFANFSSIAIQIGGIGGMAPDRRTDLSRLGLRAMVGGTLATFMCASVAGILL
ncbi:MAG: NupC/NupG family nucleoside CNT transporter [Gemmatimonadota bacterium]